MPSECSERTGKHLCHMVVASEGVMDYFGRLPGQRECCSTSNTRTVGTNRTSSRDRSVWTRFVVINATGRPHRDGPSTVRRGQSGNGRNEMFLPGR